MWAAQRSLDCSSDTPGALCTLSKRDINPERGKYKYSTQFLTPWDQLCYVLNGQAKWCDYRPLRLPTTAAQSLVIVTASPFKV